MFMLPDGFQEDEGEDDHGPPDPHNEADFEHGGDALAQVDPLDPLANFIKELQDLLSMSCSDISALVSELPVPQDGDVEGMSVDDAVEVCLFIFNYSIGYLLKHLIRFCVDGRTRTADFHQERAYSAGSPETEKNQFLKFEGSYSACVAPS